jgi:hypothetical protein
VNPATPREHGQAFQRSLRPHLLHDPDRRVRDQDESEQRILEGTDDDDDREHRAEESVESREDVRPDDLAVRPRTRGRQPVDLAARDAFRNLGCAQASSRIDHAANLTPAGQPTAAGCR